LVDVKDMANLYYFFLIFFDLVIIAEIEKVIVFLS